MANLVNEIIPRTENKLSWLEKAKKAGELALLYSACLAAGFTKKFDSEE